MHLNLDESAEETEDSETSRANLQTPPKSSKAHKAQSTSPQQVPSDFDSKVKAIVDAALQKINTDLGKIVAEMKQQYAEANYAQHDIRTQLTHLSDKTAEDSEIARGQFTMLDTSVSSLIAMHGSLADKLDQILKIVKPATPPSSTQPDHSTSSSPSFQFNTPPVPSSTSPTTPPTEPFPHDTPSTPPTEPFPTPTQLIDPTIPLSVRTPPPTPIINLDDVKGGEEKEKNQD